MLEVGASTVVFGPAGPRLARELRPKEMVTVVQYGRSVMAAVRSVAAHPNREGYWLFSSAGDVIVGASATMGSSSGPLPMAACAAMRDVTAIGAMNGNWPRLEAFAVDSAQAICPAQPHAASKLWTKMSQRLRAEIDIGPDSMSCLRIGTHEPGAVRRFVNGLLGLNYSMETGPGGWNWVQPATRPRKTKPQVKITSAALLCPWQVVAHDTFALPVEHSRLRHLTFAGLAMLGQGFTTRYTPRYLPATCQLQLTTPQVFAVVQGVIPGFYDTVEIEFAERGAYLPANSFFVAT